jgi:hypothetical protein
VIAAFGKTICGSQLFEPGHPLLHILFHLRLRWLRTGRCDIHAKYEQEFFHRLNLTYLNVRP